MPLVSSLRAKFLLGIAGIIISLGLVILLFVKYSLTGKLHQELLGKGIFMARHLAEISEEDILTEKFLPLRINFKDHVRSDKDIMYLFILDAHGKAIVHTFDDGFPVELKDANVYNTGAGYQTTLLSTEQGVILDIATPISKGQLGVLHLGLSEAGIARSVDKIINRLMLIIFLSLLFGGLPALLLTMPITNRVTELVRVARAVGRGDLGQRVVVSSKDEMSLLASAFNKMTEDLRNTTVSRDFLETIVSSMNDGLIVTDADGRIELINRSARRFLGKGEGNLIGCDLKKAFADQGTDFPDIEVVRQSGTGYEFETRLLCEGKDPIPFLISLTVMANGIICIMMNISWLREVEAALSRSKDKYYQLSQEFNAILDAIPDNLTLQSSDLKVLWANQGAACGLNKQVPDLLGEYCYALWHGRSSPCQQCPVLKTFKTGQPALEIVGTPDGRLWELRTVPVKNMEGKVISVIELGRDITESRKMESQVRQSQKMEAIGQLAGGIAHDFNNILSAITGYAALIQYKIGKDATLKNYLSQITQATEKGANLTSSILTFSRKSPISSRPLDVNATISEMKKLLSSLIREDIELVVNISEQELIITADPVQIDQIIINLATNSRDAMPRGGTISITTGRFKMTDDFIKRHGYGEPGDYAHIAVSDTGLGMDDHTRERIFEPFFTTKEIGVGTGLGLATVYGIVKQNDGYIVCSSEPGLGTTFDIYWPMTELPVHKEQTGPTVLPGGSETILLGEDNPGVRSSVRGILEAYGYHVIEAVDGEDAVLIFTQHKGNINLLLLDVIMPKKNGREVYEEIKLRHTGIKALLMSGYTADILQQKGVLEGRYNFIKKPVTAEMLLLKVRQVLDGV